MGFEIRFRWRDCWRHELHRWPLTRKVLPHKVLWDIGDEILPPLYFDEQEKVGVTFIQECNGTSAALRLRLSRHPLANSSAAPKQRTSPLGAVTNFKFYCPEVGLVRKEFPGGSIDLVTR
ncbi:MAG: hypothetical protein QME71_02590 [Dehalococcoidia bacterium]|nr:hypothetical protein [Dehalococcoidia bacterium]